MFDHRTLGNNCILGLQDLYAHQRHVMLCLIVQGPLADYQKPWQSPVPPLVQSVELVEKYPSDEEESGVVLIGWRGPLAQVRYHEYI